MPNETEQSVQTTKRKTPYFKNLSRTIITSPNINTEEGNETSKAAVNEDKSTNVENRYNIPSSDNIEESDNFVFTGNIVRNFGKCSKFEEILKNKYGTIPSKVNQSSDQTNTSKEKPSEPNNEQLDTHEESGALTDPNVSQNENTPDGAGQIVDSNGTLLPKAFANSVFKILMSRFLEEVRKALREVKILW